MAGVAATLDERRLAIVLKLHSIRKPNSLADSPAKLLSEFLRKADESTLGRILVELAILQTANSATESSKTLRESADHYKVDIAAITAKVRQEFAVKDKSKTVPKAAPRMVAKSPKKAKAA